MLGQHIATLASGRTQMGVYEAVFNADRLSTGIYVCRFVNGDVVVSSKLVLQK